MSYLTTMQPSERMVRWLGDLALYHFEVKHIPGSTNTAADALSRLDTLFPIRAELDTTDSLEKDYWNDEDLGPQLFT